MTRISAYRICMIGIFLSLPARALAGPGDTPAGDSVSTMEDVGCLNEPEGSSVIERMTDEQLSRLIDLLFEMDSIPNDLAKEINRVVALRTKKTSIDLPRELKKEIGRASCRERV